VYRKQVRRRRAVLALLVIGCFVLLTASFGQRSSFVSSTFSTVFGPFEEGATRALKPARDLINWFDETFEARGENKRLRAELEKARAEAVAGQAARQENEQLRDLLRLSEAGEIPSGFEPVTARVIARSPSPWTGTVTIDRGSSDGVSEGDPVINEDGLVGQISAVYGGSAMVLLISDPSSRISGKVVPSGVQGILQPEIGNPKELVLGFLDRSDQVRAGSSVVTAGWRTEKRESRFPPNIPVGVVTRAPLIEQEASQQVFVRPHADLTRLDFVSVLTGGRRG
jgi:rod shape-determining protein MreC